MFRTCKIIRQIICWILQDISCILSYLSISAKIVQDLNKMFLLGNAYDIRSDKIVAFWYQALSYMILHI